VGQWDSSNETRSLYQPRTHAGLVFDDDDDDDDDVVSGPRRRCPERRRRKLCGSCSSWQFLTALVLHHFTTALFFLLSLRGSVCERCSGTDSGSPNCTLCVTRAFLYTCVRARARVRTYDRGWTDGHECVHAYMHMYIYIYIYKHTHIHTHTHTHTHTHVRMCALYCTHRSLKLCRQMLITFSISFAEILRNNSNVESDHVRMTSPIQVCAHTCAHICARWTEYNWTCVRSLCRFCRPTEEQEKTSKTEAASITTPIADL
jgi:hypothetical protein